MFPRPEVKIAIRVGFYLSTPVKGELVVYKALTVGTRKHVRPTTNPDQEVIEVITTEKPDGLKLLFV